MQFANPIWLWGLTGLLIPTGIHLLSRKQGKVIQIGSTRHLEESNTKQSLNLRLNELILLAMRCLLITLIVFLLSGLHVVNDETKNEKWLVIENGLEKEIEFTPLIDSLRKQGFVTKRLAESFPALDISPIKSPVNYWKLMEDLKTRSLQQLVVLTYNYAERFRGKRIGIPANVTLISKIPSPKQFSLKPVRISTDSVSVRVGNSNADETSFGNVTVPLNPDQRYFKSSPDDDSISVANPDTLSITLVSDPEFEYDRKIMLAVLYTVDDASPTAFIIKNLKPDQWKQNEKVDWLIWLTSTLIPDPPSANQIIFREDETKNKPLLEKMNIGAENDSKWLITKRLNEETVLQEKLPVTLASILLPALEDNKRAREFDRRVQPEKMVWSSMGESGTENIKANVNTTGTSRVLAIIILILLLTERLIAFRRNQ